MVFRRRTFVPFIVAISTASIAAPAIGAPPIAYAKQAGTSFDLYLTNPNGSGTVKLYSSPAKNTIGVVDMNPATNEVAIVESRAAGFKIISYTDAGVRTNVTAFDDNGCRVQYLDYHPSDGSLLVNLLCSNPQTVEIRIWANGAYQPAMVSTDGQNDAYGQVRWLGDGSGFLVTYSKLGEGSSIQRRNLSNPAAPTTIWTSSDLAMPSRFDVARCTGALNAGCSKLLYTAQSGAIRELTFSDFGGGSDTIKTMGFDAHYSPDNSRFLYRASVKGGHTLNVTNPAQTTAPKATYNGKDWRP
jgi:hypothetical protein